MYSVGVKAVFSIEIMNTYRVLRVPQTCEISTTRFHHAVLVLVHLPMFLNRNMVHSI